MNDEELKKFFNSVILKGKEFEKLCNKLLLAINDTPGFKTIKELHDFYGGKNLKRTYDELCNRGLLNKEVVSAQLAYFGDCYFQFKGEALPLTKKGIEQINQLINQS